jgi:hypothetical protein
MPAVSYLGTNMEHVAIYQTPCYRSHHTFAE